MLAVMGSACWSGGVFFIFSQRSGKKVDDVTELGKNSHTATMTATKKIRYFKLKK